MSKHDEPVFNAGVIVALVEAVLAALVAFGVTVTPEQHDAVLGLCAAILAVVPPIVAAVWSRARVTPNVSVVERVEDGAVVAGPANDLVTEGDKVRDLPHGRRAAR